MVNSKKAKAQKSQSMDDYEEVEEDRRHVLLKPKFDDFLQLENRSKYESFKERVELYFITCPEIGVRQTALFLSAIHLVIYELIKKLVRPSPPSVFTVDQFFEALDKHFIAKVNCQAERFKFGKISQEKGEQLQEFLTRLREGAKDCNFGGFLPASATGQLRQAALEEALLDRFVTGVRDQNIQCRLLEEDPRSLATAYEKACTLQMAFEEQQRVPVEEIDVVEPFSALEVNEIRHRSARVPGKRADEARCHRCGNQQHDLSLCPGKNVHCWKCDRVGHFAKWCRNKRTDKKVLLIAAIKEYNNPLDLVVYIFNNPVSVTIACKNVGSLKFVEALARLVEIKPSNSNLCVFSGELLRI